MVALITTGTPSSATEASKDELKLYTPKDIDAMAVTSGIIECDCSFIATTDVSSIIAESVAATAAVAAAVADAAASAEGEVGDGLLTDDIRRTRTFSKSSDSLPPPTPRSGDAAADAADADAATAVTGNDGGGSDGSKGSSKLAAVVGREDLREYQEAICYFREFLAKGHADLGRRGPICPFVPKALKQDLLYLSVVRTGGKPTTVKEVEGAAKQFLTRYSQLEPRQGRMEVYKAVLLIFPDVSLSRASECIDQVQATLKPEFVRQGLMIGEFHKNNNASGLRNPDFFPLRTPTPCLAIRRIVATDLAFLDLSKYARDVREEFLECYLRQFDTAANPIDAPHPVKMSKSDRIAVENAKAALAHLRNEKMAADTTAS